MANRLLFGNLEFLYSFNSINLKQCQDKFLIWFKRLWLLSFSRGQCTPCHLRLQPGACQPASNIWRLGARIAVDLKCLHILADSHDLPPLALGLCDWLEEWALILKCIEITTHLFSVDSPRFHLSPVVIVWHGAPTGMRLHQFPSRPVFTPSLWLPCWHTAWVEN